MHGLKVVRKPNQRFVRGLNIVILNTRDVIVCVNITSFLGTKTVYLNLNSYFSHGLISITDCVKDNVIILSKTHMDLRVK